MDLSFISSPPAEYRGETKTINHPRVQSPRLSSGYIVSVVSDLLCYCVVVVVVAFLNIFSSLEEEEYWHIPWLLSLHSS